MCSVSRWWLCSLCTCVLGDLSLGDHLFTLGVHQLAVLVLLQTLENIPGIRLCTEPLHRDMKGNRDIESQKVRQGERISLNIEINS